MYLEWRNVDVIKKTKTYDKKYVSDACGHVINGLLAVVGPNGSGKRALIKALAGQLDRGTKSTGNVFLNGEEREIESWIKLVGYVDRNDYVFKSITARETVKYAAKFKINNNCANIDEKLFGLFDKLGITHTLDHKMKNLSISERKAVSIAQTLITDPKLIFLDEPTLGFDKNMTLKTIKLLKEHANEGRIIIFSIQQLDDLVAAELDSVLLLSQGRSVYIGKVTECEQYFVNNGFKKRTNDSFVNFLMKMLRFESDVYQESYTSDKLNILAENVKKSYGFNGSEKHGRCSNDFYINMSLNLKHILLLLKRRFKLDFFRMKNMIFTLIVLFVAGSVLLINVYIDPKCIKHFDQSDYEKMKELRLDRIDKITTDSFYMILTWEFFIYTVVSFIPISSGVLYHAESYKIQQEIALNMYSITSYYVSILLFIFIKDSFIFALYISIIMYHARNLRLYYILLGLLTLSSSIVTYFLFGNIFHGIKKTMIIYIPILITNILPNAFFISSYRFKHTDNVEWFLTRFFNVCPSLIISIIPDIIEFQKLIKVLKQICDEGGLSVDWVYKRIGLYPRLIDKIREVNFGVNVPIWLRITFALIIVLFYVMISVMILSIRMMPNFRMKLDK